MSGCGPRASLRRPFRNVPAVPPPRQTYEQKRSICTFASRNWERTYREDEETESTYTSLLRGGEPQYRFVGKLLAKDEKEFVLEDQYGGLYTLRYAKF